MSIFKKNTAQAEVVETKEKAIAFDSSKDFEFVQLDSSIHDQKFKTKPTTFIKDALKRFVKNKSSVVAASILGVLILMAIIVPLADGNDVTANNDIATYLPPKWFNKHNGGFLDGTGKVSNVTIDPVTGFPAADSNGNYTYRKEGVVGGKDGITLSDGYADNPSSVVLEYGKGGALTVASKDPLYESFIYSTKFDIDLDSFYELSYTINEEYAETMGDFPTYSSVIVMNVSENNVRYFTIEPEHNTYGTHTISNVADIVKSDPEYNAIEDGSVIKGRLGFMLSKNTDAKTKTLTIESVSFKKDGTEIKTPDADSTDVISFSDATKAYKSWAVHGVHGGANKGLYHSKVTTGAFTYDYYAAAYCDDTGSFTESDFDRFYELGYLEEEFNWKTGSASNFKLTPLGEERCPAREILELEINNWGDNQSKSANCVRSRYRYFYYVGYTAKCAPIKFFFGTDNQGHDFFKVVFSGLLTSLELGFLASAINIVLGVIWGAISGYFGGWVDMIMERLTEILGGMPWIVLMTLIVLMFGKSNFWIFLFALCLTGWIGTSVTTRSQFYRYKGREYVLASRTLGASDWRLIFMHILPNGIGTIVTGAVLMIPGVIFSEASISYLLPGALSFQGAISFGVTLSNAQTYIQQYPYMIISASIVMSLIMICFNLFGNGLRDAFNPSTKGAAI